MSAQATDQGERAVVEALLAGAAVPGGDVPALLHAAQAAGSEPLWQADPRLYRGFSKALIRAGHPTRGYELAREGLERHPGDLELRYWEALALARGGNLLRATAQTLALLAEPGLDQHLTVEALSLAGRLAKDRFERTVAPRARARLAREAAGCYERAYHLGGEHFPGINAATMSLLAGHPAKARRLAAAVRRQATAELAAGGAEDYWLLATLGEAALLLGDQQAAITWYGRAVAAAGRRLGDVASMRRNVRLLATALAVDEGLLAVFALGSVVAFSGHMLDHPARTADGQTGSRFPADPALEHLVGAEIGEALARLHATVGYSSAACGADVLFAEQMLARGAELHLVLPCDKEDFRFVSVDLGLAQRAGWSERFDRVLGQAAEVHYATAEHFLGDDVLFDFANSVLQGLAVTRAAELGVEPRALLLLDPASEGLPGGARSFRAHWDATGHGAEVIDLAALRARVTRPAPPATPAPAAAQDAARSAPPTVLPARGLRRRVKVMLFSDVKNFSKLSEEQTPAFFVSFLNEVKHVLRGCARQPSFLNTWGDGLFLVFDDVVECADFATRLLDRIERVKWERVGLPADTTVRIGIHAGPVYPRWDSIIERTNYFGSHVNRAARTEPVTTPGCAFTSEQFAALLAVAGGHDYTCEYVGVEKLAKEYDRCALYRLARRSTGRRVKR